MFARLLHSRSILALGHAKAVLVATALVATLAAAVPLWHVVSDGSARDAGRPARSATVRPLAPTLTRTPPRRTFATPASGETFTITGTGRGLLVPGGPSVPIDLRLRNSGANALAVTSVRMDVTGTSAHACAADNFVVVQQLRAKPRLDAGATVTLSTLGIPVSRWPELRMVASPDQQTCEHATVKLRFSGAGTGV